MMCANGLYVIVILYVEKVSEAIARIMKKYTVKPWRTLKGLLGHPKDKLKKEDVTECAYRIPCANCNKTYIGKLEDLDYRL